MRRKNVASNPAEQMQDEFLSAIRKSQDIVLQAIKTWVDSAQTLTSKAPSVQLPFADQLPKPEDIVSGTYDFAEQVLANQRKFAEEILEATAPLLPHDSKGA
jgi:hypothetical protein